MRSFWRAIPALIFLLAAAPLLTAQTDKSDKPAETTARHEHGNYPDPDMFPVETIYLTNTTQPNDANEITTALRNMLNPAVKVYLVPSQNAIMMRADPEEMATARKIVHDLDRPHPEVVVDVTILNVSKERLSQLGKDAATALLQDKDAHVLQRQSIRAADGHMATVKTGTRVPVVTGVSDDKEIPATARSEFQYVDMGTNIAVTPSVHETGEVSLKLKIELSSQGGSALISGVNEPVIAQRVVEQTIQLHDGEPGILDASSKDTDPNETVFLVVPHIVPLAAGADGAAALASNRP